MDYCAMKNKQVKQMMNDVFFIDYAEYRSVVSITAMDHWLFLRNHKIEKESWQVTIK